jgi:hypothetical protein
MAGFPIAWGETHSLDSLSELSPYSLSEIEDYLFSNHYHWMHDEPPTIFCVSGPHAEKDVLERRYWVFVARDRAQQRQWFVLVGTGKSPFDPTKRMKRWMYAESNDEGLSPEEFLDKGYREQLEADASRF